MSITTVPGPSGQPPITVVVSSDVLSYAYSTLVQAVDNLITLYEEDHGGTEPTVVVYTPNGLNVPSGKGQGSHPLAANPSDLYIENFTPDAGQTYFLANKAEGLILGGGGGAVVYGRSGANEMLVGNSGNDSIHGHGGSGTIITGSGDNHIHSGHGNVMISAGTGNDTIHTGKGNDTVMSFGNATVYAGSGNDVFYDDGNNAKVSVGSGNSTLYAGAGYDDFIGGSGLTVMHSGTGADTFTGGSGLTYMEDSGTGSTTFDFNSTYHGSAIVTGFNSLTDSISLEGYTVGQLKGDTTVSGGSSFVNLGDGTKIVFVGVDITKLPSSSFH